MAGAVGKDSTSALCGCQEWARVAQRLRGEEFGEEGEDFHPGLGVNAAESTDQPRLVHGPDLVEDDLAGLALEPTGNAG